MHHRATLPDSIASCFLSDSGDALMATKYQKVGQIDVVRVTESSGCLVLMAAPALTALWALAAVVIA